MHLRRIVTKKIYIFMQFFVHKSTPYFKNMKYIYIYKVKCAVHKNAQNCPY